MIVEDAEHLPAVLKRIRRGRMLLDRQLASAQKTRGDLHHCIREAIDLGEPIARLARISGYTPQRIQQLRSRDD